MSARSTDINTGFIRCAVTKIDLKGRFVFIDDRFEQLVGCTKEDLFGKSLTEFLSDSSRASLDKLLSSRNHYETYFDTTCLTLLAKDQSEIDVRIIVSLNFIGGNPVNFQLIILPSELSTSVSASNSDTAASDSYINSLITLQQYNRLADLSQALLTWSGAEIVTLYENSNNELKEMMRKEKPFNPNENMFSLGELDEIHYDIYNESSEYCFINREDLQSAVEKYKTAPDEYIGIVYHEQNKYLVRISYNEEYKHDDLINGLQKCSIALQLFRYHNSPDESGDNYPDVKFTIGFLDALSVPAFLTDFSGKIIGYNSAMLAYFDAEILNGDYIHLLNKMKERIDKDLYNQIIDYINSQITEANNENFSFRYQVHDIAEFNVTILKLSDDASDLTSCFVFMPVRKITQAESCDSPNPDISNWFSDIITLCADTSKPFAETCKKHKNISIPSGANEKVVISDILREKENQFLSLYSDYRFSCAFKSMPVLAGTADGWNFLVELIWHQAIEANDTKVQFTFKGIFNKSVEGISCSFTHRKGFAFDSRQVTVISLLSEKLGYRLKMSHPEQKTCRYTFTRER